MRVRLTGALARSLRGLPRSAAAEMLRHCWARVENALHEDQFSESSPPAATCEYLSVEMFENSEWAVADKERSGARESESAMLCVKVGVGVSDSPSPPIVRASSSLMSRRRSSRESVRAASMSSLTLSMNLETRLARSNAWGHQDAWKARSSSGKAHSSPITTKARSSRSKSGVNSLLSQFLAGSRPTIVATARVVLTGDRPRRSAAVATYSAASRWNLQAWGEPTSVASRRAHG